VHSGAPSLVSVSRLFSLTLLVTAALTGAADPGRCPTGRRKAISNLQLSRRHRTFARPDPAPPGPGPGPVIGGSLADGNPEIVSKVVTQR